ncbi:Alpha/beta hydrolase fold-1 [Phellopilus nigrolimitatus]|nr:Alpha/beta hydrolase fold-1 [Phellopilus nigrolimitatus]
MPDLKLQAHSFVLDARDIGERKLKIPVKHYTLARASTTSEPIVLLLAHGAGLHKEQWEPFLEDLQRLQFDSPNSGCEVVEAWAVDSPNHGEGGVVNEKELLDKPGLITCSDFAQSILSLFDCGYIQASDPRRLVLIGHSAGVIASIIASNTTISRSPARPPPFSTLILAEPTPVGVPPPADDSVEFSDVFSTARFVEPALRRRDVWPSRAEAHRLLSQKMPWKSWDPRCLVLFEEHGLRPLPTLLYPDLKAGGLTLSCTKLQESDAYANADEPRRTLESLPALTRVLPVHVVFGAESPFCPSGADFVRFTNSKFQRFVSVFKIPGAGHNVVQDAPTAFARHVLKILRGAGCASSAGGSRHSSKL